LKVNSEQIAALYAFTESHFVEWYDVQTELVDHLANGIEQQWQENPQLRFKDALDREFKKFGVMGFSSIVEEKTKALNKTYWKLIWQLFKSYLSFPKLMLSLFLLVLYYQLLVFSMQFHVNWVLIPTLTMVFGAPWYFLIREFRRSKKIKMATGKKWLFDKSIAQLGGLVHLMNFGIYFQIFFHNEQVWPVWLSILFSIFVIAFGLLLYIAILEVAPRLRKNMAEQYHDYPKKIPL